MGYLHRSSSRKPQRSPTQHRFCQYFSLPTIREYNLFSKDTAYPGCKIERKQAETELETCSLLATLKVLLYRLLVEKRCHWSYPSVYPTNREKNLPGKMCLPVQSWHNCCGDNNQLPSDRFEACS